MTTCTMPLRYNAKNHEVSSLYTNKIRKLSSTNENFITRLPVSLLGETLTENQVTDAHEAIKTLANPRPLPVVTNAQKETPAGQTYAAARKIHESRLSTAIETLNSHVVYHAPTLPEDVTAWAQNQ